MALSESKTFTFTWKIQNFNMCPQKVNEELLSPVFLVKWLDNSEWQLKLYPKGFNFDSFISCYLRCISAGSNSDFIRIGFSVSVVSDDATKRETKEVNSYNFKRVESCGYPSFVSRDAILGDQENYLPNNTLTIKCLLWRIDDVDCKTDSSLNEFENEILSSALEQYTPDCGLCDGCGIVTRVVVQSKQISWSIRRFSSLDFDKKLSILVSSALINVPSFFITFSKSKKDQSAGIEIRWRKTDFSKRMFFKCKVSVLQTPKGVDIFAEGEQFLESDVEGILKFPSFIKLNKLEEEKFFNRTSDVLHLRFEFSFSQLEDIHHMENGFIHKYETHVNVSDPIKEFGLLYKDGELSDVTIRVDDRKFKVHKIILIARSPVIKAMFENDMKEKETGFIDITDVDPNTVDRLLTFMYTNAMGDMLVEDVLKLYAAADKYQVLSLRIRCAWILTSNLSVSNVCEVLALADQHNDECLRDCAEDFIEANSVDVFKSQEWDNLIQNSGTVAAKVMFKMVTK